MASLLKNPQISAEDEIVGQNSQKYYPQNNDTNED